MTLIRREYGYFPRWPQDGTDWIHPEDVQSLIGLIPSDRIFLLEWEGDEYATLYYGDRRIRIRPALWETVPEPKYEVGDEVEICSRLGHNEFGPGRIREVIWDRYLGCARYEVEQHGMRLHRTLLAEDLRPVDFLR